jgi:hypothetical protein
VQTAVPGFPWVGGSCDQVEVMGNPETSEHGPRMEQGGNGGGGLFIFLFICLFVFNFFPSRSSSARSGPKIYLFKYTVADFRHTRRGHQISL